MQGTRLDVISTDYVRLLMDHGTIRPGYSTEELFYAVGAVTSGFYVVDATVGTVLPSEIPLERKADLLAATIRGAFELEPPAGALEAIAPGVLKILTEAADICRSYLRAGYEGRGGMT